MTTPIAVFRIKAVSFACDLPDLVDAQFAASSQEMSSFSCADPYEWGRLLGSGGELRHCRLTAYSACALILKSSGIVFFVPRALAPGLKVFGEDRA